MLLEDPELPNTQGFNSVPDGDVAAASQESTSHEPVRGRLTNIQALNAYQKMAAG